MTQLEESGFADKGKAEDFVRDEAVNQMDISVAFEVATALQRMFTGTPARWYASPVVRQPGGTPARWYVSRARSFSLSKLPGFTSLLTCSNSKSFGLEAARCCCSFFMSIQ